ncbi:hypothetical protein Q9L42_018005 [Methylomarinum sp. Ch1-1]|uniref:Low-complexity protein n=1 Tax=Methylomarinum roseum TaxID=3067653 RepID=A0AAU7NT96_9GAMM|nr:hypothetical protein [Methylomarinum sp. Ch1-1]MDP4519753.1 hypothetical protein [Methylomarinum sp. Ch1-1]
MKKSKNTPFAIALGTSLVSGLSANVAQADASIDANSNPFALTELSSGYMQTAQSDQEQSGSMKMKDGSCGEGKCGGAMMQGNQEKAAEGKCAGNKPMPSDKTKDMEGKCGEGKCGGSMKK